MLKKAFAALFVDLYLCVLLCLVGEARALRRFRSLLTVS